MVSNKTAAGKVIKVEPDLIQGCVSKFKDITGFSTKNEAFALRMVLRHYLSKDGIVGDGVVGDAE